MPRTEPDTLGFDKPREGGLEMPGSAGIDGEVPRLATMRTKESHIPMTAPRSRLLVASVTAASGPLHRGPLDRGRIVARRSDSRGR